MNKIKLTHTELQYQKNAKLRAEICYYRKITDSEFDLELIETGIKVIEYYVEGIGGEMEQFIRESYTNCKVFWGAYTSRYYFLAENFLLQSIKHTRGKRGESVNEFISKNFPKYMNCPSMYNIDPVFLRETSFKESGRRRIHDGQRK